MVLVLPLISSVNITNITLQTSSSNYSVFTNGSTSLSNITIDSNNINLYNFSSEGSFTNIGSNTSKINFLLLTPPFNDIKWKNLMSVQQDAVNYTVLFSPNELIQVFNYLPAMSNGGGIIPESILSQFGQISNESLFKAIIISMLLFLLIIMILFLEEIRKRNKKIEKVHFVALLMILSFFGALTGGLYLFMSKILYSSLALKITIISLLGLLLFALTGLIWDLRRSRKNISGFHLFLVCIIVLIFGGLAFLSDYVVNLIFP